MARPKDVYTTGEVAKICGVAPRTVSKWFDSGKLRGYKIPGSKDRRIPRDQLIKFMRAHDIPLNGLETGESRVLLADADEQTGPLLAQALSQKAGYEVTLARSAFEAGAAAETFKPHVIVMDMQLLGLGGREAARSIRTAPNLVGTRLVAVVEQSRNGEAEALRQIGFDGVLLRPFDVSEAVRVIEETLGAAV